MAIDDGVYERCECGADGFAQFIVRIEIAEGKARPPWLPHTERTTTVCLECLWKAVGMSDEVLETVEEVALRGTEPGGTD